MKQILIILVVLGSNLGIGITKIKAATIISESNPTEVYKNIFSTIQDEFFGKDMKQSFEKFIKITKNLFQIFLTLYIVLQIGKSFINGQPFLSNIVIKIALCLFLSLLLDYGNFDKYIYQTMADIFHGLPAYLTNSNANSIFSTLSNTTYNLQVKVWGSIKSYAIFAIFDVIGALIASIALWGFVLTAMITILYASLRFFLVMNLAGLWILCFFFQYSRAWATGAVKVVVGAILNITILTFFIKSYHTVLEKILTHNLRGMISGNSNIGGYLIVAAIAILGIFIIKQVNAISGEITGSAIDGTPSAVGMAGKALGFAAPIAAGAAKSAAKMNVRH